MIHLNSNGESRGYAIFYFFHFGFLALTVFFPVYCQQEGFDASQLAWLSAGTYIGGVAAGPAILQVAYRFWSRRHSFLVAALCAVLSFLVVAVNRRFWPLLAAWAVCFFFWRCQLSLAEAQAVRASAAGRLTFERVRLFGSLGYVASVWLFGWGYDGFGATAIVTVGSGILVLSGLAVWAILGYLSPQPERIERAAPDRSKIEVSAGQWRFWLLVLIGALTSAAHAPLYAYLSVYLRGVGWSGNAIAWAWNVGVLAETTLFVAAPQIKRLCSLWSFLTFSVAASVLRWLLLLKFESPWAILVAQVLHAFSFGGIYLSTVHLTFELLPDIYRDRGQGILSGLGNGAGAVLGALITGVLASNFSSAAEYNSLFLFSAMASGAGLLLALIPIFLKPLQISPETAAEETRLILDLPAEPVGGTGILAVGAEDAQMEGRK